MPRIVACGGRQQAFEKFKTALTEQDRNSPAVLLVDSEDSIDGVNPWEHVRRRPGDEWERPPSASDDQLQLMVQTMEAWFHGDREALQAFNGQHFRLTALNQRTDVEMIPKAQLFSGLQAATKNCLKGEYSKGEDSFKILAKLDATKVRAASSWCERLMRSLDRLCR